MWVYEKKLLYPVEVSTCNPTLAKYIMEQYGGADGELAAALRYMNQRYTVPSKVIGVLNDIATEEFSHLEMLATMIYKLTKDATPEQLVEAGLGAHFVNHGHASLLRKCGRCTVYGNVYTSKRRPDCGFIRGHCGRGKSACDLPMAN